jgi:hypothetical protein
MIEKTYRFADIPVLARYRDTFMEEMCREYETGEEPQYEIAVTKEDVEREIQEDENFPYGYLETLAFYRKFCRQALMENVILFHSSVVAVDDKAYLFTAPSGTGKSTHTALWRKVFGERAVMINDDKPLIRFQEDGIWVYGTPWDGKHRISTNTRAKVRAICILERGESNRIWEESFFDAYPVILNQTYRPDDEDGMAKTLELVNVLMTKIKIYRMSCTISEDAAKMAYETMK